MAKAKDTASNPNPQTPNELRFDSLLSTAVQSQGTGCFWDGSTWASRWELQRKFGYYYYGDEPDDEGYRSNVKSPEISGRIQSTKQKMNKFNLEFVVRPKRELAKFAAEVEQLVLNAKFKENAFRYRLRDCYDDAIVNGTGLVRVEWLTQKRDVEYIISNADEMTDQQKEDYLKTGKFPTKKTTIVDYDDVTIINDRLERVFVDPTAQSFNTGTNRAGYVFIVDFISKDRFETLYNGNNKAYKNLDSVGTASKDDNSVGESDGETGFLEPPKGMEGDFVKVIRMYDYDKDKYMIKANNVFIYEGPLPYNDKKIPMAALRAMKAPYQFYGIGVPDLLIPIVTQIELISNSVFDYVMYTTNPMFKVQASEYGAISRKYTASDGKPGTMLPVKDVSRSLEPIKFPPLSMDIFQAISGLQKDAVIASQQDPTQLGFLNKNATATANILNKEIAEAYVAAMIESFKEDLEEVGKMVLSRIHQFMTQKEVEVLVNGKEKEEGQEGYEVPVYDREVDIDWKSRSVKIKDKPGGVSFVNVGPELFKWKDDDDNEYEITPEDFDVSLSAESVELISKALEKQDAMEMVAQLAPFAVDPSNPAMVAQHPQGWVDGPGMLEEAFEKRGWDKRLLLAYTGLEKDAVARAKKQNFEAFQGQRPIPYAGESRVHINIHNQFIKESTAVLEGMAEEIKMSILQAQPIEQMTKDEFDTLRKAVEIMSEHVMEDSLPVGMETAMVSQKGLSAGNPMGQNQMGNSVSESGMGGNPQTPNPVADQGMQGGPGQLGGQAGMPPM